MLDMVSDGDVDPLHGGGGEGGGQVVGVPVVSCSICLEMIIENSERSWAKLQCGHKFHLDCIGSAFNVKGTMQCPNCRKVERGQWLYANQSRQIADFRINEWPHEEDLYELAYPEMSFGIHWCPFNGASRFSSTEDFTPPSFEDVAEAFYSGRTSRSANAHPCPFVEYFGPVAPVNPSSSSNSNMSDASTNVGWNMQPVTTEVPSQYSLHTDSARYQNLDHVLPRSARVGATEQPITYYHLANSGHRAGASGTAVQAYPGSNARARDRIQALQAYYYHPVPRPSRAQNTVPENRNFYSDWEREQQRVTPSYPLNQFTEHRYIPYHQVSAQDIAANPNLWWVREL